MTVADSDIAPTADRTAARARARVGVFGIGLEAYWPQFDGPARADRGLPAPRRGAGRGAGGEVVSAGLVDTAQGAREAGDRFAPRRSTSCSATRSPTPRRARCCRRVQAAKVAGGAARPAADGHARLREHRHRRVAGQLRRLLRAGDRGRLHACADPVRHGRGDDRRRRARVGQDRGLGPRGGRRAGAAARADRLPRAHLSGDARHVLGLHGGARAARRARRGARDRRPRRARRRRSATTRSRAKQAEIRAMFAFADPSDDPIAGPIEDEQLDWSARVAAGLDRLAADFDLDALTYYYRGIDGNEAERLGAGRHRRQLAADRPRHPDRGRGRPQDERRPADPRPARRRRLVHRVLRARLRRGLRPHGPRRRRCTSRSPRAGRPCARCCSTTASAAPA